MPFVYLSPSTQEYNVYSSGRTNEEEQMNLLADRMEPYLRSCGIGFTRNNPDTGAIGAIRDSNAGEYDVHLALHTNAAPENLSGKLRGIDIYYSPQSADSERLANIIANNLQNIYPVPGKSRALPTYTLGEVTQTKAVAVLAEIGYHDNPQDEAWLKANLGAIARNLTQSLCDYFGLPFIAPGAVRRGYAELDSGNLNIRNYPSVESAIVGRIPMGAEVNVYGQTNGWYSVGYNGVNGFASAQYIRLS